MRALIYIFFETTSKTVPMAISKMLLFTSSRVLQYPISSRICPNIQEILIADLLQLSGGKWPRIILLTAKFYRSFIS